MKSLFLILLILSTTAFAKQTEILLSCNITSGPIAEVTVAKDESRLVLKVLKTSGMQLPEKTLNQKSWQKQKFDFIKKIKNPVTGKLIQFGTIQLVPYPADQRLVWNFDYLINGVRGVGYARCD